MNLVPRKFFLDNFFEDGEPFENMKCDIYEKDNNYFIEVDIPGFDKKDIDIDYDNGYITISASKETNDQEKNKNYIRRERTYGKYQRQFYIGDVTEKDITATFSNGILKIVVPKKEEIETKKKIEIE